MRPWCDARCTPTKAATLIKKNCNWCLSQSLSCYLSVCYEHCTICYVCVTERFSIVHRAYLWTGKRDINVMAPHYLCHFARYALFFISIHSQLLFVNLPWMTIMSTIQISHATFVYFYASFFSLCTIVINGRFFISLSFLFSPELLLFIVTTLFSFASLRLPLSRLRVAIVMLSYLELVIICSFYSFVCLFIRLKCHSQNVNAQRAKERKISRGKKEPNRIQTKDFNCNL